MAVFTSRTWIDGEAVTSAKMNDIVDDSQFTIADSIASGNTTLTVVGGKLKVGTITSAEMGTDSVTTNAIVDGNVTFAKIATAAKATKSDMVARTSGKIVTADQVLNSPYIIKARAVVQLTPVADFAARPWTGWGLSSVTKLNDSATRFNLDPDLLNGDYTVVVTMGASSGSPVASLGATVYSKDSEKFFIGHIDDSAGTSTLEVLVCGFSTV